MSGWDLGISKDEHMGVGQVWFQVIQGILFFLMLVLAGIRLFTIHSFALRKSKTHHSRRRLVFYSRLFSDIFVLASALCGLLLFGFTIDANRAVRNANVVMAEAKRVIKPDDPRYGTELLDFLTTFFTAKSILMMFGWAMALFTKSAILATYLQLYSGLKAVSKGFFFLVVALLFTTYVIVIVAVVITCMKLYSLKLDFHTLAVNVSLSNRMFRILLIASLDIALDAAFIVLGYQIVTGLMAVDKAQLRASLPFIFAGITTIAIAVAQVATLFGIASRSNRLERHSRQPYLSDAEYRRVQREWLYMMGTSTQLLVAGGYASVFVACLPSARTMYRRLAERRKMTSIGDSVADQKDESKWPSV